MPQLRFHLMVVLLVGTTYFGPLLEQVPDNADRPFQTWKQTLPYRRGVVIWLRSTGPDTLHIKRVTVSQCLNIGAGCGETELNLWVAPGDSVSVLTIRPRLWDDRYVYQLAWDWEVRSVAPPVQ